MDWHLLEVDTITVEETSLHLLLEIRHNVWGETEFTGDEDLLTASELETGSVHSLLSELQVLWLGSKGHKDLIDSDTGGLDVWLTESTSHTLLESISTSAGQHLVDTDGVPWMWSNSKMESVLGGVGDHVFVGSNTGGLKRFRTDHFLLLGDKMDGNWEVVPLRLLLTTIIDTDLGVWHTTIVARLGVWLVLLVSVATSWSASHFIK